MDCKTARFLLDFARPSSTELEESEADALENHLASCSECETLARTERRLDDHLGQALRNVPLPEGLHGRLLHRLQTEHSNRRRNRLAWTVRIAAAAAVLLVAGGLVFSWYSRKPADLDVGLILADTSPHLGRSPESIEEWFHDKYKVTTVAPRQFNYGLLAHYDLTVYQKRRLPMLFFIRGENCARVYIVSDKQFNLDALRRNLPDPSGNQRIEVLSDNDNPRVAYLVIYTGELRRFLTDDHQPQRFG